MQRISDSVLFTAATLLTLAAASLLWLSMDTVAYAGGDGKAIVAWTRGLIEFARPFDPHTFNPLQGLFGQHWPINVWGNPGYWPFLFLSDPHAAFASQVISAAALIFAAYVMARSLGIPAPQAIVGSQCAIFAFSPFLATLGFPTQMVLVPPTAICLALITIAACLPRLLPAAWWGIPVTAAALAAVLGYALYADPLYFAVAALSLAALFGVVLLGSGRERMIPIALSIGLAALVLWAVGFVDFITTLLSANSRVYFAAEHGRPQLPVFAVSLLIAPEKALLTYLVMGAGWILLLFGREGRLLALLAIVQFALLVGYSAVYLLAPLNLGAAPPPLYLEQNSVHIFLCAAGAGYAASLARLFSWLPLRVLKQGLVLAAIPLVIIVDRLNLSDAGRYLYSEPWAEDKALSELLGRSIALKAGEKFRGTLLVGDPRYLSQLSYIGLWRQYLPTANEYSHQHSVPLYYFSTRFMGAHINMLAGAKPHAGALAALGVRYLAFEKPDPVPGFKYLGAFPGRHGTQEYSWHVQEHAAPNTANYGPTETIVSTSAEETLNLLAAPQFDFRRQVVLGEKPDAKLQPLKQSELTVGRGELKVRAESDGTALLVLPVQYGRCWTLHSKQPARMLRANFLLMGIQFDRQLDARLTLDFGLLNSRCRRQDIDDMKALGVQPGPPRMQEAEMRPYQARSWSELVASSTRLMQETNRLRVKRCASTPPPGPISKWLGERGLPWTRFQACF